MTSGVGAYLDLPATGQARTTVYTCPTADGRWSPRGWVFHRTFTSNRDVSYNNRMATRLSDVKYISELAFVMDGLPGTAPAAPNGYYYTEAYYLISDANRNAFATRGVPHSIDTSKGFESKAAARIDGNSGTLIQSIPVKESQTYYVRVRSLVEGKGQPSLSIRWQTRESTWSNIEFNQVDYAKTVQGSDWGMAEGFARVPAGAEKMVLLLSASGSTPQDKVWFDKLEVYPLDDLYEAPNTYKAIAAQREGQNRVLNSDFKNDHPQGQVVPVKSFSGYWLWHEPQDGPVHHALDNTTGYESQESASMAGMKAGSILQNIVVEPGQRFSASVYGKHQGEGSIGFRIGWMRGDTWTAQSHNVSVRFEKIEGSDWSKAAAAGITVPQGANRMVLIMTARGQKTDQDRAWFDRLEAYKQD